MLGSKPNKLICVSYWKEAQQEISVHSHSSANATLRPLRKDRTACGQVGPLRR